MPTEVEELRLVITLTDNASGGIEKLRQASERLGSGATQGHIERFKRSHNELAKQIKDMQELVTGGEKAMLGFIGKFGVAGAAVAAFGVVLAEGIKGLNEFSTKLVELNNKAKVIGVHPAVLKSIEEQLAQIGVGADQADENVAKFNEAYAKMGRVGSAEHLKLVQDAGHYNREMEAGIQSILHQRTEVARINEALAQAQNVYNNRLKDTNGNIIDATDFTKQFMAAWGIDPTFALIQHLHEVSDEEKRVMTERSKATADYYKQTTILKQEWDDWMDDIKTSALAPNGLIVEGLQEIIRLVKFLHGATQGGATEEAILKKESAIPYVGKTLSGIDRYFFGKPEGEAAKEEQRPGQGPLTAEALKKFGQKGLADQLGLGDIPNVKGKPGAEAAVGGAAHLLSTMGDTTETYSDTMKDNTGQLKRLNDYLAAQQLGIRAPGGAGGGTGNIATQGTTPQSMNGGPTSTSSVAAPAETGPGGLPVQPGTVAPTLPPELGGPSAQPSSSGGAAPSGGSAPLNAPELDTFSKGARARGVLGATTPQATAANMAQKFGEGTGGGGTDAVQGEGAAALLARKRAGFKEELKDPETRKLLGAVISSENVGAGSAVAESLMNRTELVNASRAKRGLKPLTLKQMMGTYGHSFYGPIKHGYIGEHLQKMNDPKYASEMNKRIDAALGGANTIKSYTDQGSKGDPNYEAGGIGVNINRERFNDWGYPGSVEWRKARQAELEKASETADPKVAAAAEANRAMVDRKSIKTVKVDAIGSVKVNVASAGGDATLGSEKLFKPTSSERQTQMVAAATGPSTTNARDQAVAP